MENVVDFLFIKIALEAKLAENKVLAERYQSLCCQYLQIKNLFYAKYERIVNEESHLKDHMEVKCNIYTFYNPWLAEAFLRDLCFYKQEYRGHKGKEK